MPIFYVLFCITEQAQGVCPLRDKTEHLIHPAQGTQLAVVQKKQNLWNAHNMISLSRLFSSTGLLLLINTTYQCRHRHHGPKPRLNTPQHQVDTCTASAAWKALWIADSFGSLAFLKKQKKTCLDTKFYMNGIQAHLYFSMVLAVEGK